MQELLEYGLAVHHSGILPILKEVRQGFINTVRWQFCLTKLDQICKIRLDGA